MPAKPYAAISISTHAPAGGATEFLNNCIGYIIISTHAPAGGATFEYDEIIVSHKKFLLTPLREGRQQFSTSPS